MNILFISSYPSDFYPHRSIFVYNIVQGLIKNGANASIISPIRIWKKRKVILEYPGKKKYGTENAVVIRPRFFSFPNRIYFGDSCLGKLNTKTYYRAVLNSVSKLKFTPDIVYSHFLFLSGYAGAMIAENFNIPAVVALGESNMHKHEKIYGKRTIQQIASRLTAILSVSNGNKEYCIKQLGLSESKIKVVPNSVNNDLFYPRDKRKMREKYGFPQNQKIVAFTGHFNNRKGSLRLLDAINRLKGVKGIFLGEGRNAPKGENVLFSGTVPPNRVSELLSAADIFVLPTLDEGSCNAILEAQACGLPIISSDIQSVREQVDKNSALLINPLSIYELSDAISYLFDDDNIRASMSFASKKMVNNNTLNARSDIIYNWIRKIIKDHKKLNN